MLSGKFKTPDDTKAKGMVSHFPRFQSGAFEHNMKLVEQVEQLARQKNCTPAQLAINWVRCLGGRDGLGPIIPIPGSTVISRLKENCVEVELTDKEVKEIKDMVDDFEPAGGRYPSHVPTNT